jgi:hypothetical protein
LEDTKSRLAPSLRAMTSPSNDQPPPACARCAQALRYVTAIPKRFDQPTGFTVFRCEGCGHIQWEAAPAAPK